MSELQIASKDDLRILKHWKTSSTFKDNVERISTQIGMPIPAIVHSLSGFLMQTKMPRTFYRKQINVNKDKVYGQLVALCKKWLQNNYTYLGLCGNRIEYLIDLFTKDPAHQTRSMCFLERNEGAYNYLRLLYSNFLTAKANSPWCRLRRGDILETSIRCSDIIDFDLMCQIRTDDVFPKFIKQVQSIQSSSTVINLTTSYGHGLTKKEYEMVWRPLITKRVKEKHTIKEYLYGTYCDTHIPMAWEMMVISSK